MSGPDGRAAPAAVVGASAGRRALRRVVGLGARAMRLPVLRVLRPALRGVLGRKNYDRLRLAVWAPAKQVARVDPLQADILPLIEQLDGAGHLRAGAARRLRSVARGIRAEVRREARST